ncbi:MAG: hypothetical protein WEB37_02735 [Bacteroidota bacterium]
MRSWLFGMGLGLAGVLISSLLVWWLASSDTSFSQRWLTLALMVPLGGVYLGWDRAQKAEAVTPQGINPRIIRTSYVIQGALLAALTQYLTFVIASSIWHADVIDPAQAGFLYQLFHPDSLPSLSDTRSGGSSTESGWVEMVLVGVFVGTVMTFYMTRKQKQ